MTSTVVELTSKARSPEANPFPDEARVLVRYPYAEQSDREQWPWLPGKIIERCGPDEWQVCVEDMSVATCDDGSEPGPSTPDDELFFPLCFRDASEIKPVQD